MKQIIKKAAVVLCIILLVLIATDAGASVLSKVTKFVSGGAIFGTIITALLGVDGFCWFCPVYDALFDAMNSIAGTVARNLKTPILALFGAGLLIWIPLHVIKTLTQLQEVDALQFLQEIMKRFGRAIVASVLILTAMPIFYYILSPMLEMTMILANEFVDLADGTGGKIIEYGNKLMGSLADTKSICSAAENSIKTTQEFSLNMNPFSEGIKESMTCMLTKVSASLIVGIAIGMLMMTAGTIDVVAGIFSNYEFAITGGLMMGSYLLIYISLPFKMIDAMVRLTFVAALVPIWVALWVFPATVEYTKNAWNMFLGSCIMFLTISVMVLLIFHILPYMMPDTDDVWSMLVGQLMADMHLEVLSYFAPTGKSTMTMAALGFLCYKMLGASGQLAQAFSKTGDLGLGSAMDTHTTRMMAGVAGGAGAIAGGMVLGGEALTQKGINSIKDRFNAQRGIAPSDDLKNDDPRAYKALTEQAQKVNMNKYQETADDIADTQRKINEARTRGENTTDLESKLQQLQAKQQENIRTINQGDDNLGQNRGTALNNMYSNIQTEINNRIADGASETDSEIVKLRGILSDLAARGYGQQRRN